MQSNRADGQVYAGLFLLTLSTLMFEILITRIFSLTMFYHFAFMAISTAMFGMTLGATIVFLLPQVFTAATVKKQLALCALFFGPSMIASFMIHLRIPFLGCPIPQSIVSLFLIYTTISIPFIFSGICTCLALTRFPQDTARLYAADLAGAALGCLAFSSVSNLMSGPIAVFATALLGSLSALLFSWRSDQKFLKFASSTASLIVLIMLAGAPLLESDAAPLLRLPRLSILDTGRTLWEKWNAHSRVRVDGDPHALKPPNPLFLSPRYPAKAVTHQLLTFIDTVPTIMTEYNGDPQTVDYLKYDIVNFSHNLRPDSRVLVIGVGGGRDILSALTFNQKSVLGVEVNENVLVALNRIFGDFSGHLDCDPRVKFIVDDGRSYVARSKESFDIIQISFVDTFAATGGGAFVLCENSLYTTDAWKSFLEHLSPRGILSVNRWYFRDRPGEMLRATSLASAALNRIGITAPRNHIMIVRNLLRTNAVNWPDGFGTILISKEAFSQADVETVNKLADNLGFEVILSPQNCSDQDFARAASSDQHFIDSYPINIAATTDDNPFFFQMLRLKDIWNWRAFDQGAMSFNMQAVGTLGLLLVIVVLLNFIFVIGPLMLTTSGNACRNSLPISVFFACIGLGYMALEISLMQRLTIYLGHPTYSLSVVLFTLLLSGGAGALICDFVIRKNERIAPLLCFTWLLLAVATVGSLALPHLAGLMSASTPERVLIAATLLGSVGLPLGCAFPLGMRLAQSTHPALTPWLWGLNGAASVTASVVATAIALTANISTAYWTGVALYVIACASYFLAARMKPVI